MAYLWQNLIIIFVLGGAVIYLAIRLINWSRRRRACRECRLLELHDEQGHHRWNNKVVN